MFIMRSRYEAERLAWERLAQADATAIGRAQSTVEMLRAQNDALRQMLAVRVESLAVQAGEGERPKTIQQADAEAVVAAREAEHDRRKPRRS